MPQIRTQGPEVALEDPCLVEGFPGVGLVGKIATDHLIEELEMEYHASVHCEGLPRVGVYADGDPTVRPPVRIYASEAQDLLALQSDVPVPAAAVGDVAECVTGWLDGRDATPIYLSGLPAERDGAPAMFGIATGDGASLLEAHGIEAPDEGGVVSGPTGALLERAAALERDGVGLVVQSNPQFPDPEAARVLIEDGIAPIADLNVGVDALVDHAEEIRNAREQLAQRMQEAGEAESSQARPMQMFQ